MGNQHFDYTLIRSSRRTLALQIAADGSLIARAPNRLSLSTIENFIEQRYEWIEKHKKNILAKGAQKKVYTDEEIEGMKKGLKKFLITRVSLLHEGTGLPKFTQIKVTKSERRWGSCNSRNSLCFSYRLFEYIEKNPRFVDAIIYHELAHLKEKNHGKNFWSIVYNLMPDYEIIMKTLR